MNKLITIILLVGLTIPVFGRNARYNIQRLDRRVDIANLNKNFFDLFRYIEGYFVNNYAAQTIAGEKTFTNIVNISSAVRFSDASEQSTAYRVADSSSGVADVSNYFTDSTTFINVSTTTLSRTITITEGSRVMIGLVASGSQANAGRLMQLDVTQDGTRLGGVFGLMFSQVSTADYNTNLSFTHLTGKLSAGIYTFVLQYKTDGATFTLRALGTQSGANFWVQEIK